ncbi:MAG: hypothetical protein JKY13_02270 [Gammaproteobacteria bacterium]|nr:hypothetical protein [Gammaproteobacteria bacterium]
MSKLSQKIIYLTLGLLFLYPLVGQANTPELTTVAYQVRQQQWMTSNTAHVTVLINATINATQLANMQQTLMKRLKTVNAQSIWHITQVQHKINQANLLDVQVQAQIRVPNQQIANLIATLKKQSHPGLRLTLWHIDYTPSLAEQQKVMVTLRQKIYAQSKQEIQRLNRTYSKQHYAVQSIHFMPRFIPLPIMALARVNKQTLANIKPVAFNVEKRLTLNAQVVLAAKRKD